MSHTPGPWKIVNQDMVVGPEGQLVADCERTPYCERPAPPTVESMVNAHLIAAAPELLEALRKAENRILILSPQGYSAPELWDIHQAITKAEGRG